MRIKYTQIDYDSQWCAIFDETSMLILYEWCFWYLWEKWIENVRKDGNNNIINPNKLSGMMLSFSQLVIICIHLVYSMSFTNMPIRIYIINVGFVIILTFHLLFTILDKWTFLWASTKIWLFERCDTMRHNKCSIENWFYLLLPYNIQLYTYLLLIYCMVTYCLFQWRNLIVQNKLNEQM